MFPLIISLHEESALVGWFNIKWLPSTTEIKPSRYESVYSRRMNDGQVIETASSYVDGLIID
jgi:hypothetical protein